MKGEYTPLPTTENGERDEVAPRTIWKRALPFLALFALVGVLAITNPMGCGRKDQIIKGFKVPGYSHLPVGEIDPFHLDDEPHRRPHHHGHHKEHHTTKYTTATLAAELKEAACPPQPEPLNVGPVWEPWADETFAHKAAERLSKAVQINTVSTDDLPDDPTDPRFDGHYKFAEYLEAEYPTIYEHLEHENVNTHGHLFTWKGTDESLKPIFLMAHVDTVPVNPETVGQWTFPPWSGEISYDATPETPGTWIWGRGASDCKNSLMGILHAVEKLVNEGFTPGRTVLIGYGFDEEIGGARGALKIKEVIEERYGDDSIAFIIDEGFSGIEEAYGIPVASLGMAEKGSVSIKLTVDTPGGHASVAPVHTGIGYMSRFLSALEDHPYKPEMTAQSPYLKYMSCLVEYAPKFPKSVARSVKNPKKWHKLAKDLAKSDRVLNAFLSTTSAIDLINGGVKINALPEKVDASVNHRISFVSSVNATLQHYVDLMTPLAAKYGFSSTIFGAEHGKKSSKHLTIEIIGNENKHGLEPAPITPGDSDAFAYIAGTVKTVFGAKTVVAPTGMFANTDTARTWSLTKHIYRWTPADLNEAGGIHTVNERISLHGHLTTTGFYYKLIRNTEGWTK
ncbi:uncharacterized protein CcaverHIS019_0407380 [Cutaneotrichosporon cavernicola]|uniref:Peptidase M20 dimerisation domain-containing protein n=1 Tax=Cutaneotrichosporon cavernicola TaxID=279322 RepID=A0AA48L4S0_9TREE|nr:uncharacterized protein CcaverHIS019_0407380 [Cutaneotrichosporon cavernicola]BEI91918.1 hypothetical protein CcaverHIS019_0407380 [Cutaneotrichosporon cavernicola]BEI99689.1 hypothetical protein CcaverHIS631_0407320 [Cutaneotrichosporon cavernicola]BEJ07464.1 hypothetical protein CcaverHIS641_0407330 [Cutaneotrichosporon cavernicola]